MIMKVKPKQLIVLFILVIGIMFFYFVKFDEDKVKINYEGLENEFINVQIDNKNLFYTCTWQEQEIVNGDTLQVICENKLFPFDRTIEQKVTDLYSTSDDISVLISKWKERGINNIVYILKNITLDEKTESNYFVITLDNNEFVGYFDSRIFYNESSQKYAQINNKVVQLDIPIGGIVHITDVDSLVHSYISKLGYEVIYKNEKY